ncbi:MAG: alpha/beta fold hydrolase [Rhodobacteraceae bacterium]|nr:alpha/beta fold hydrolase [Paracoccaceae bacterium]
MTRIAAILAWVPVIAVLGVLGIVAVALGLIVSQPAKGRVAPDAEGGLDFSAQGGDATVWPAPEQARMRDGSRLTLRRFGTGGPLVVLVHGSGWHGRQFARLAPVLGQGATVLVPDLRGHGASPDRRGDIDHIGQLEEDLADLVDLYRQPGQQTLFVGHSSGGGLVVRMAGGRYGDRIDSAVLLAPYLHHAAPTARPRSGGWAQPMVRRIIGLGMLNGLGIGVLNHLTVIRFAFPARVLDGPLGATATTSYSYRLNRSYAPRRTYLRDIAALPRFVLIAGRDDEAFVAARYAETMSAVTDRGRYVLLDGVGHLGVVDAPETRRLLREAIDAL